MLQWQKAIQCHYTLESSIPLTWFTIEHGSNINLMEGAHTFLWEKVGFCAFEWQYFFQSSVKGLHWTKDTESCLTG